MKTPSIKIQCNQTPELTQLVSDLCKSTQDFIDAPDSPLGDLSAELDQLLWTVTPKEDIIIIIMVFDISKCNHPGVSNFIQNAFIQAAAKEACTSANALPRILNYGTDLPFGQFHYDLDPLLNTLTFIATYPMP